MFVCLGVGGFECLRFYVFDCFGVWVLVYLCI